MTAHSKNFVAENLDSRERQFGVPRTLWARLIEVWISAVLATFFLIRVLGSHSAQRLLDGLRHSHHP
jgi:hypothetical protein